MARIEIAAIDTVDHASQNKKPIAGTEPFLVKNPHNVAVETQGFSGFGSSGFRVIGLQNFLFPVDSEFPNSSVEVGGHDGDKLRVGLTKFRQVASAGGTWQRRRR